MNYRQMQYAVLLAEARNFSQVAESLSISQPALSKQIISLEQDLGVKLFDRSTSPLTLTPAGEQFIEAARELLYREDQLKRSMEGFKTGERGRLVIGISPFRSLYLVPEVIRRLHEKYPGAQVILNEAGSTQLHKEAVDGQYDFAIMNLPVDEALLDVIPLEAEKIVLAVPAAMADMISCSAAEENCAYPVVDLKDCSNLPFVLLGKQQILRQLFDKLCITSGLSPKVSTEVVGVTTAWAMARAGVGATILPLQFLKKTHFDEGIRIFALSQKASTRQPVIVIRKGRELSEYARYAIDQLLEMQKQQM